MSTQSDSKVAMLYQLCQQENPYQELDCFRKEWEAHRKDVALHSYRLDRKVWIDRCIFFGFSFFFLLLGAIVYFQTNNWACAAYFSNCQAVKAIACAICLVLSAIAFWVGSIICAKKHVVNDLVSKTKKNLARWYRQKLAELRFHLLRSEERKRLTLYFKQAYHQALDHVIDSQDEAFRLIDHITHWPNLTAEEQENLLNQTLLELNDKMHNVVNRFKGQSSARNLADEHLHYQALLPEGCVHNL